MYAHFPTEQLLKGELSQEACKVLFTSLGFQNWKAALQLLRKLAESTENLQEKFNRFLPTLLMSLSNCPDPDLALVNFDRFIRTARSLDHLQTIENNPRVLEILLTIFSGSQYLTEILFKDPENLEILINHDLLAHQKTSEELSTLLTMEVAHRGKDDFYLAIRKAHKKELLRIGAGDLLGILDLSSVTQQLSRLADATVQLCLETAATRSGQKIDQMVVLGMGKLGGDELNYSSDIDLLFISEMDDLHLVRTFQILIDLLTRMTEEGFLYRVDMRLRPWGRDGSLVTAKDAYAKYISQNSKLWEKQALIKARPIAGNLSLGYSFLTMIEPIIYSDDPVAIKKNVFGMKNRTEEILRGRGKEWGQVKLGSGSIRDVEFVVQYLQLLHGDANPKLRKRSTLQALRRLHRFHFLTNQEARILTDGYIFLRTVEHFLQLMHYRQTYTLPSEPHSIFLLSKRLGFQSSEAFLERYEQHSTTIRSVYAKFLIEGSSPITTSPNQIGEFDPVVQQHISRMDSEYSIAFDDAEIIQHAALVDKLSKTNLCFVDPKQVDPEHWKITIVAFDYLGELSLICGLMFLNGLNILSGDIFTYIGNSPFASSDEKVPQVRKEPIQREKIVDVFLVKTKDGIPDWNNYQSDLNYFLSFLQNDHLREARSELAIRIGKYFAEMDSEEKTLFPIEMTFDNEQSETYTIIKINTTDTIGFLYEFTNALSLTHIYIHRMIINTDRSNVNDQLYVSDEKGRKIIDPEKLQELQTAAVLIKHFTHLLPRSPNPAAALLHFREFLSKLFTQHEWRGELNAIENPQVIDNLARLLGGSDFLWDDFIRMQYQNLFPVIMETDTLSISKNMADYQAEITTLINSIHAKTDPIEPKVSWKIALNEFKDREMFRIDMRHILGQTKEFWDFSEELTCLTDVVVTTALTLTVEDLRSVHGTPRDHKGGGAQVAVMALGKCGGRELGFASDIELMFIYSAEGTTDGTEPILNSLYFEKVVQNFLSAITAKQEGIFQIDLRLRPYGNAGSLAVEKLAFEKYYAPTGPAWPYERQALVKMRLIAGNERLGEILCDLRDRYVYGGDPFDVIAMRAMREKQVRHLVAAGKFNAKYSPGGLVDIEYLVQGLQINFGRKDKEVRRTNIRSVMDVLVAKGYITLDDYTKLHKAHTFLRWLIDSMRVVRGNSKDVTVPDFGTEEYSFLCRRLKFGNDIGKLQDMINQIQSEVVELNRRLLT